MIGEAPKPGSTALPLFLFFPSSLFLSFSPCLPLSRSPAIPLSSLSLSPSLFRDDASFLPFQHLKIGTPSPSLQTSRSCFFLLRFLFSAFNSLLQDSLDSLEDYVSCYYSSRGTPPRIPSSSPLPPAALGVPSALSTLLLIFGYRFIDLLLERISGAR